MAMYHRNNYKRNRSRRSQVAKRGGMSVFGAVLCAAAALVCAVFVLVIFHMSANPVPAILPVILIVAIGGAIGAMCDEMGW
ncbi:MAG: hypothetical protein E7269_08700 [Lachnospiraceae bacterium]|nr:hypothetical protein [Lachnospiraceae bacterium]